MLLFSFKVLI